MMLTNSELLKDMQCMTLLPSNLVLLGGHQQTLIEFDLERIKQVRITDIEEDGCVIIRQHPKLVCCGDIMGKITVRDPNSLRVQHTFSTHSVTLSDFDVHGNYLVTCGYSNRNVYSPDRFLMVYDLRMMRQVTPIQMMFSPYLLRFVPAFSSRFCVVSQTGQFQLLDTSGSLTPPPLIHNVDLTPDACITAFDVSTSCQAMAFADSAGYAYLFGASNEVVFNNFSQPTEFADTLEPVPHIAFDDVLTPYSTIPMPYYGDEKLLSDWPPELCQKVYRLPQPIDPQILNAMRMVGSVGYAPNPGNKRRNQMPYETVDSSHGGRNLKSPNVNNVTDVIPNRYQLVVPNHNKVMCEEFAFGRYNHSPFAGLDSTLPNSYANNIIQTLYFISPLHTSIMNHLCTREFCLTCELAFLFHMMDMCSRQVPCQASNFLRAFRTMKEASALSLVLPEDEELKKKVAFSRLAQSWIRFILHQLHSELSTANNEVFEGATNTQNTSIITELFGLGEIRDYKCKEGHCWQQDSVQYPITLSYPEKAEKLSFVELLHRSLLAEQNMSAYCEQCQKFQPVVQNKRPTSFPDVLTINCGLDDDKSIKFWNDQLEHGDGEKEAVKLPHSLNPRKACRYGNKCTRSDCIFTHENRGSPQPQAAESWLPLTVYVKLMKEESNLEISCEKTDDDCIEYNLINVISVIKKPGEVGRENIVSAVKIDDLYFKLREKQASRSGTTDWYLFNHFTINAIPIDEVTHTDLSWKVPGIVMYARKDVMQKYEKVLVKKNPITADVFGDDRSLAASGRRASITFTPLSAEEMPGKDDTVAVDAEFVTLNPEETEIRSDGTRATIKPPQRSVARITCIRGSGSMEGQPFIDDYISTQEQVADFMTEFSGIKPGDLDISIKIQSETHDSIEDAKTALSLYRKYEELTKLNQIEEAIEDLYETGKKCSWNVPST
ncbi:PAB-dependent poly(A)-specific ribonuclease subunit PAN2-like protein [Leptotrombidium deliense]|uniref:PAB-dependent poly(A)-specific ribonuclease subunit PAN2-like protein n=1 Tax=Leptotrombidium deliense TaxID=299467 RepID=A0A443SS91_9ACAR|nr:PAB-dependent poly(A)-specific ribonuclease subunit PAN2-like protein [Leptotrombidium deliense]